MDRTKAMDALREELTANEQAVRAVQAEVKALARQLRKARGNDYSQAFRSELTERLQGAMSLLQKLAQENRQLKPVLRRCLAEWQECVPHHEEITEASPGSPLRLRFSERALRLGTRALEVLAADGVRMFFVKTIRRVYRKFAAQASHLSTKVRRIFTIPATTPYIFRRPMDALEPEYRLWMEQNEPSAAEWMEQRQTVFSLKPRISVVMPTYNTPVPFLLAAMESVRAQTYPHWELCIADGGSATELTKTMLRYYADKDSRIKVVFLAENRGIAGNSNAALELATGDYLALLDHDDILAPYALFEIVQAMNRYPEADLLYSDEDKITTCGRHRFSPHFKSAWAPDTLRSVNYICHLTVLRRTLLKKVGGFRAGFEGSQDYDLILRATEQARQIVHIPKILYHWRSHPQSVAGNGDAKTYAFDAAKKALREHLSRSRVEGHVQRVAAMDCYRIVYRLPRRPRVSIIIPSKDHHEVLRRCVESIAHSTYTNYEIIIVENKSRDPRTFAYYAEIENRPETRIVPWNFPFNYAAATNFGVRHAQGDMLLLLNNDVEIINRDWLECLLEYAVRPDVGAVGAKLFYPNGSIQHGGVAVGLRGVAGHTGVLFENHSPGYMRRLGMVHNVSAVTGACLMTPRSVFHEVGGLDERLIVNFNDIDYCLKLRSRDYLIVWTPFAQLYHFESLSRGLEDTPEKQARFHSEVCLFKEKWQEVLREGDPYYSPNLTHDSNDWAIRTKGVGPHDPRIVKLKHHREAQAA